MRLSKNIVLYFLIVPLLALAGCSHLPTETVLPGILEQQIRTKVEGTSERLVEYLPDSSFPVQPQ
jgi:hypothetical protein